MSPKHLRMVREVQTIKKKIYTLFHTRLLKTNLPQLPLKVE